MRPLPLSAKALLLAMLVTPAAFAAPAAAQSPPPLTNEVLAADEGEFGAGGSVEVTQRDCDPDGTSTVSYTATGTAIGPYPGTFTEQGTFSIGPQAPVGGGGFGTGGAVLSFDVTFVIDSEVGYVTGQKHAEDLPSNFGYCRDFTTQDDVGLDDFNGSFTQANADFTFTATITTDDGTFTQSGTANGGFSELEAVAESNGFVAFHRGVHETFNELTTGPAFITLDPAAAVNPVGTSHTVTATVTDAFFQPVEGAYVRFFVTRDRPDATSGSCTTDANGQCSFTYQGPDLPGADLIEACAQPDEITQGETDPCTTATKAWVLPTTTPGQVTGGGHIPRADDLRPVAFGFVAKSDSKGPQGTCNLVDQVFDVKVKCLDVTSLVQVGGHATIFGNASVNGTPTTYRIDVDDNAEPGTGNDSFRLRTANGYTVGGVLSAGNIQAH